MSDDIVARLRDYVVLSHDLALHREAADEIERLRHLAHWAHEWYWSTDKHIGDAALDSLGCAVMQFLPHPDRLPA